MYVYLNLLLYNEIVERAHNTLCHCSVCSLFLLYSFVFVPSPVRSAFLASCLHTALYFECSPASLPTLLLPISFTPALFGCRYSWMFTDFQIFTPWTLVKRWFDRKKSSHESSYKVFLLYTLFFFSYLTLSRWYSLFFGSKEAILSRWGHHVVQLVAFRTCS